MKILTKYFCFFQSGCRRIRRLGCSRGIGHLWRVPLVSSNRPSVRSHFRSWGSGFESQFQSKSGFWSFSISNCQLGQDFENMGCPKRLIIQYWNNWNIIRCHWYKSLNKILLVQQSYRIEYYPEYKHLGFFPFQPWLSGRMVFKWPLQQLMVR